MEWRILAMGCRRTIPETAAKVHELGGLYNEFLASYTVSGLQTLDERL